MQWAIMLPTSMLSQYGDYKITKIGVYVEVTGSYNLKIYKGGVSAPSTQQVSYNYSPTQTGWRNFLVEPALSIDASQSLWVSLTMNHEAGTYPATYSEGCNTSNARWVYNNGTWLDVTTLLEDTHDLAWMVRVYVTNEAKGGTETEIELPLYYSNSHKINALGNSNGKLENRTR